MIGSGRVAPVAMCEHGCPWHPDHDTEGRCHRDCGRCPEAPNTKCAGFETPHINRFPFQRHFMERAR